MTTSNKKASDSGDMVSNYKAWLSNHPKKDGPPCIASAATQARHDSEWQNPTVIARGDTEGLRKAVNESKAFRAKYSLTEPSGKTKHD